MFLCKNIYLTDRQACESYQQFNKFTSWVNIRYGKMSLALLSQAASYQFRQKLPKPYDRWNAIHLSDAIFNKIDGDIRVENDTIIVTCYNVPNELNLQNHYENLPEKLKSEGINPRVPWLYNFKVDFRFK